MSDVITWQDIQEFIDEKGFYAFEEDHFEFNGSKIKAEKITEDIASYSEGCVGTECVFKVGEQYFKIYKYEDSWGEFYEYVVRECFLDGYKQVPIFTDIEVEEEE